MLLLLLWLLLLLHNRAPRPQGDDATYRGLPLQFGDVIVDGARLPAAVPVRGRFVTRAP